MKRKIFFIVILCSVLIFEAVFVCGCASFTKKFTRKKKVVEKEDVMILVPEEYNKPEKTNKDAYQDYYIVWKSWHKELEDSLTPGSNPKKQSECLKYVIENLNHMKSLLQNQAQAQLDVYIDKLKRLSEKISEPYIDNFNLSNLKDSVVLTRRNIQREFSYSKISKWIK